MQKRKGTLCENLYSDTKDTVDEYYDETELFYWVLWMLTRKEI